LNNFALTQGSKSIFSVKKGMDGLKIKSIIHRAKRLPTMCWSWIRFQREVFLDGCRYLSATPWGPVGKYGRCHFESDIVRRYHVIEKGLCMPDFRPRFGISTVIQLSALLEKWYQSEDLSSEPNQQIEAAVEVLAAYHQRHEDMGIDVSDLIDLHLIRNVRRCVGGKGGVMPYRIDSSSDRKSFVRVIRSRSSVRTFVQGKVPEQSVVKTAVETAISSPSVCNRQSWRVHCFTGAKAQAVLALQNGNRGFGHMIPLVMVVTSDMRSFTTSVERNQPWIDGGMFAMTLLLGLHGEGLGAVPLNWSVHNTTDSLLRQVAGIPDYQRVIMLIGCGYPEEGCLVTRSQRRPCDEVVRWATTP